MSSTSSFLPKEYLPPWYPFTPPGNAEIGINEWKEYAKKRLNLFARKEKWTLPIDTSGVFSGYLAPDFFKTSPLFIEEIGGHLLLRLAASQDPRAESWLVEEEGDLFEFRLMQASFFDKLAVAKHLFGEKNVLSVAELTDLWQQDETKEVFLQKLQPLLVKSHRKSKFSRASELLAVHFTQVPSLIAKRAVLLMDGWAIAAFSVFKGVLKKTFESQLRSIIRQSRKHAEQFAEIKALAEEIAKVTKDLAPARSFDPSTKTLSLGNRSLSELEPFLPPCIRALLSTLQNKGHLPHVYRLQLGLFLKRIGMSVEEQLKFWYSNAVDNVGLTYDEFVKKVGYQIRHLYGLEGARIDYDPPKCTTCIDGYFCFFAHKDLPVIDEFLTTNYSTALATPNGKQAYQSLLDALTRNDYTAACAAFLQLTTGVKAKRVFSMLHYLTLSLRSSSSSPSSSSSSSSSPSSSSSSSSSPSPSSLPSSNTKHDTSSSPPSSSSSSSRS